MGSDDDGSVNGGLNFETHNFNVGTLENGSFDFCKKKQNGHQLFYLFI